MRYAALGVVWLVSSCTFDASGVPFEQSPDAAVDTPLPDAPPPERDDGGGGGGGDGRVDPPPPPPLGCPSEYVLIQGSRYRLVTTKTPWLTAEKDCEDDGEDISHLVVFESELEHDTLFEVLKNDPRSLDEVWIGVTDRVKPDTFLPVIAGTPFLSWDQGQPDDGGLFRVEDCVEMRKNGRFNDESCDVLRSYVCECDGNAADKDRYDD